ncbi:hypothetical protein [Hyalangium versicolor]|uniref:hypothetical protein n=1 Tax=Hyalangium versicolor TaxID=2861190 RepID=UPI001CCB170A|nr:hypothetical protein [Hyalangium versicolor]
MTSRQIRLGSVQVTVPEDWTDITDEVESPDKPYTLADSEDGVGALQFSVGLYKSGPIPNPTRADLRDMVLKFGEARELGDALDDATFETDSLVGAGMSYHAGENFVRVWNVSDKKNFALVTYVCQWGKQEQELSLCEDIVQSLRFANP